MGLKVNGFLSTEEEKLAIKLFLNANLPVYVYTVQIKRTDLFHYNINSNEQRAN